METAERTQFFTQSRLEFMKATEGHTEMNLQQFIRMTGCRSRFYAVSTFDAIDVQKTGSIRFGDYIQFKKLVTFGSVAEKGLFIFALLDRDSDGWLTRHDMEMGLKASSDESEKPLKKEELQPLLEVLMRLFVSHSDERIDQKRFSEVLESYPDLMGAFQVGEPPLLTVSHLMISTKNILKKKTKYVQRWITNHPVRSLTYVFTTVLISAAFFWLFWKFAGDCADVNLDYADPITKCSRRDVQSIAQSYFHIHIADKDAQYMAFSSQMAKHDSLRCQDARQRVLFGWTLPLAKGCGRAMKVIFTLILFPVSRSLMTWLRDTPLRYFFDFDGAISYHKLLGKVGFLLAWIHSIAHFVNVYRQQDTSLWKEWSFSRPSNDQNRHFSISVMTPTTTHIDGIPSSLIQGDTEQPTALKILKSPVSMTGFLLLATYTIAVLFAFDYPKGLSIFKAQAEEKTQTTWQKKLLIGMGKILNDFTYFWYTHHLFVLFYLLLIFHPMPLNPLEERGALADAWLWILIPVLIYLGDRLHRSFQRAECTPLVDISALPGRVLALKMHKPEGLEYKSGQYVMLKCCKVSRFEWHPFTLTSAPQDPYLSVHIRAVGDWTTAMYEKFRNCRSLPQIEANLGGPGPAQKYPVQVQVAGPYGAPAQEYIDYRVVVCVGAGIGVTPFASVLSNVLHSIRSTKDHNTKKVYFHWVVRSRNEASWFTTLLEQVAVDDVDGILSITVHVTNMKNASNLRLMLLRIAQFEQSTCSSSVGFICKSMTRFGRPDWAQILTKRQEDHKDESKIGVFYCGPNALKRTLRLRCEERNKSDGPKFVFNREIF